MPSPKWSAKLVLQRALALFGKNGERWIQGSSRREKYKEGKYVECFCSSGALDKVDGIFNNVSVSPDRHTAVIQARYLLKHAIHRNVASDDIDIIGYNDTRGRKFEDIKKVFQEAIKNSLL